MTTGDAVRRDDGHAACREVEQRLREANRRLQAEGPAVERDKLITALRADVERSGAILRAAANATGEQLGSWDELPVVITRLKKLSERQDEG